MKKHFLLISLLLMFAITQTNCSLFSSGSDDQESAAVEGDPTTNAEGGDEFASDGFEGGDDTAFDPEAMASDDSFAGDDEFASTDVVAEDNFDTEEGSGVDNYPDDSYNAQTADAAPAEDSSDYIDDNSFASDDYVAVDEGGGLPDSTMASNQEEDLFGQDTSSSYDQDEPVVDTPSFSDNSFSSFGDSSGAPQLVSVKKMKPAAYAMAGANINRLYIARPGDNMRSIAQKVYGEDRSKDLYKYNPHFVGKSLKVGDKVYYESATNKNDPTMMTFYEENGVSPQYYTSDDDDNIRTVAKKLLGHERSWMEIYATNANLESKGRLPAGLQLRYWPGDVSAPLAQNNSKMFSPPPAEVTPTEESFEGMNDMSAADMGEAQEVAQLDDPQAFGESETDVGAADAGMGGDDFSPPPTSGTVGQVEPPQPVAPPPPPAPRAMQPPLPPQPSFSAQDPMAALGDDSTVMGALGVLLILAAVIMFIFIRRSRAKRVNFSQTQI